MRLTLYEIETTLRKASIGAGLPMGLAQDIGCAVAWLAAIGKDGVAPSVCSIRGGMRQTNIQFANSGRAIFSDTQIAVCGPSVIDLLVGELSCTEVQLLNYDAISLLFGFAGVAASHHNCVFNFEFENGAHVSVSDDKIDRHRELDHCELEHCDVIVTCSKNEAKNATAKIPCNRVEIDDDLWCEAEALAAKTYVPESDDSRLTGAGAGLSDND